MIDNLLTICQKYGMDFDFIAPEWLLPDVLSCVRGLTQATLQQRISRGLIKPEVPSRQGSPTRFNGFDVMQIALHHVLTRQGVLSSHADFIWEEVVRPRIVRRVKMEDENRVAALLHVSPDDIPRVLFVDERKFVLAKLDLFENKDEPVRAVLRVDHFIDEMVERMRYHREMLKDYDPDGKMRARYLAGDAPPTGRKTKAMPGDTQFRDRNRGSAT